MSHSFFVARCSVAVRLALLFLFLVIPQLVQSAALDPVDDAALTALYNATGGASWTNSTGWSGSTGIMDTAVNPPYGVVFDPGTGRVTEVSLDSNNLVGDISALDWSGMTKLTSLHANYNQLSGNLPTTAQLPTGIQMLSLGGNQLTGTVPDYSTSTALTSLVIDSNQLSGGLPTAAQLPSSIQVLYLGNNQLTGTIPDYSTRTALTLLDASSNQLSGSLPTAAQLPASIQSLYLINDQLTGTIPDYSTLTALTSLVVHLNQLSGDLPTVAQLPAGIQSMNFSGNQLTGTIPDYSTLTVLRSLLISNNQLSGSLPTLVQLPAGIQVLALHNNQLTGTIPDYSTLASLTYLNLMNMNIQGPTPSGLLSWAGTAVVTTTPAIDPALDGSGQPAGLATISGTGGEPGGTVELFLDGVSVVTGISVGGVGEWSTPLDLSGKTEGTYTLTAISHFDNWPGYAAGQASTVASTAVAIQVDMTAPVITLIGPANQSVEQGATYTDSGATVSDNVETGLTATVTGSVDTTTVGTYTLTYNVTDNAGNAATPVERTVEVTATASSASNGGGGGSANPYILAILLMQGILLVYRNLISRFPEQRYQLWM